MLDFSDEAKLKQAEKKIQKHRKDVASADDRSIKKLLSGVDKLRPIRDIIEPELRKVYGFNGIMISGGVIVVMAYDNESKEKMLEIVKPYKKKVVIKLLERRVTSRSPARITKGKAGPEAKAR